MPVASIEGGPVRPHVQAFADALSKAVGQRSFGTYPGHQPTQDRALDIFHNVGDDGRADAICDFAIVNYERFGLTYIISRQRIYNPSIGRSYWRDMEDRGGTTANHFDHVHISFNESAANFPDPTPEPKPKEEDEDMIRLFTHKRGAYIGVIGAWWRWVPAPGVLAMLERTGVKWNDTDGTAEIQDDVFDAMTNLGPYGSNRSLAAEERTETAVPEGHPGYPDISFDRPAALDDAG